MSTDRKDRMQPDYLGDLKPVLDWIDACNDHAAANPESRIRHMVRDEDGGPRRSDDAAWSWRAVLVANRDAGMHLPAELRRTYWNMTLVMFDIDPAIRALDVQDRAGCLHVDWDHGAALH